jgi:hypothetical protein
MRWSLELALKAAQRLGNAPMPVALGAKWLRQAAKHLVERSNRPDLTALLQADDTKRIAAFWDKNVARHREPFAHWESPLPIAEALNMLVSGESWMDRRTGS